MVDKKTFLIYYCIFVLLSIGLGVLFGLLVSTEFFHQTKVQFGWNFTGIVLEANTKNFLSYLFFFLISPILQLLDLIQVAFQIVIGIRVSGFRALAHLFPHGVIEIPNFLWYQGMSQFVLYTFLKTGFSFKAVYLLIKEKRTGYLLSYLLLIIAAVIEGWIG